MAEGESQGQQIHYEVPVELANGVYANHALVHHSTEHEITLDFCQVSAPLAPGGPRIARIVSRVYIAPSFVTPLLQAISTKAFRQDDTIRQTREEGEEDEPADEE